MTLFPRDINIDQLGVRSLIGCLFVYVTKEKAYSLVSFSARKMFLYFFLHRILWGLQWYHQILFFTTSLLRKRTKTNCNMFQNFENFLTVRSTKRLPIGWPVLTTQFNIKTTLQFNVIPATEVRPLWLALLPDKLFLLRTVKLNSRYLNHLKLICKSKGSFGIVRSTAF